MSDPTILEGEINFQAAVQPTIPTNVQDVMAGSGGSPAPFFLGLLGAGIQLLRNNSGSANVDGRSIANQLRFAALGQHAGVQILIHAAALRRASGQVDISLKTNATFQPACLPDDGGGRRLLFQDQVSFDIWPVDPSLVNINPVGVSPDTDVGEVSYSNTVTWTVGGGFGVGPSKVEANVKADYSTQVSVKNTIKDFDIRKSSQGTTDRLQWASQMRNLYVGNVADTTGYDARNLLCIVDDGAFSKSLKDPAPAALSDLDLQFHAAYTSVSPDIVSRQLSFEFEVRQRLIYAELGDGALAVPYYVISRCQFALDFPGNVLRFIGRAVSGYNCTATLPAELG